MTGHPKRWLPAAVVVVAVAAMAVAARHDGPVKPGPGHGLWQGARPAVGLAALTLLIVIATNFAKRRDDGYGVLRRAGTATAVLLTAAAVATPLGLLFLGRRPQPPPAPLVKPADPTRTPQPLPAPSLRPQPPPPRSGKSSSDWIVQGMLLLIAAAVLALLVYLLVRLLARRWFPGGDTLLVEFDPLAAELDELTEAVAAGTEALEYEGDAREAVIACYSAMEQAVGAGGGVRRATDTPEEFLRRVTASKLIPESPAARLTELFREARFSRHPIAESQRDEAREALREISEHVRTRAVELAAATARAKAAAEARLPEAAGAGAPADGRAR